MPVIEHTECQIALAVKLQNEVKEKGTPGQCDKSTHITYYTLDTIMSMDCDIGEIIGIRQLKAHSNTATVHFFSNS